jgi:hypothetical protein
LEPTDKTLTDIFLLVSSSETLAKQVLNVFTLQRLVEAAPDDLPAEHATH